MRQGLISEDNESGFTLIELLVVILIIGVLAAIAIPMFLNQRKVAVDASLKADIKQMINVEENWLIKNSQKGFNVATIAIREPDTANIYGSHNVYGLSFNPTPGNYIRVPDNGEGGYCVYAWSPNSSQYKTEGTAMSYNTRDGIIGSTACSN